MVYRCIGAEASSSGGSTCPGIGEPTPASVEKGEEHSDRLPDEFEFVLEKIHVENRE